MSNPLRPWWWLSAAGLAVVVVVVWGLVWAGGTTGGVTLFTSQDGALAAEQISEGPEDCWGGALDGEPMACYVLEHAQADGALEVAGVFLAPSGPLYVMLDRSEPIDEDLLWVLESKYKQYATTPELDQNIAWDRLCGVYYSVENCVEEWTVDRLWMLLPQGGVSLFSGFTSTNDDVLVLHGGLPARQKIPGWASWKQLWPRSSELDPLDQTTRAAHAQTGQGFDVSDVDLVSGLGDEDCESHEWVVSDYDCSTWRRLGHLGMVAGYSTRDYFPGETPRLYLQVKEPPDDPEKVEELIREVLDDRREAMYETGELIVELVPVKFGLGELWRWAVILDRFKYSKGNTMGLTAAWLDTNGVAINEPADIRITINVAGLDPRIVAEALPQLLPALGIPVDAVGRVEHEETDQRRYLFESPDDQEQATSGMPQEPFEVIIPIHGDSVNDRSDGEGAAVVVDSSESSASDGPSGDASTPPDAGDSQGDQQAVTATSPDARDAAAGPTDTDLEGVTASQGSGGSVERSASQSLAASSDVAPSGSTGATDRDGGVSVWWLMGLAAIAAVAAMGVGLRRARRA